MRFIGCVVRSVRFGLVRHWFAAFRLPREIKIVQRLTLHLLFI